MTKNLISNSIKFLMLGVFCFVLSVGHNFAQTTVTGGIRGNVTDPKGDVIANATITATNNGTNRAATVTTDENGSYRFNNLQPGTYTLKASSSGFSDFTNESIIVEVGKLTEINLALGVAGTSATVDVTSEAPVINTSDNSNSSNINQTSINELPINGRRASNFVLLTPGVTPDGAFGLISFRGISGLLNNSTIDGGDNNQAFFSEERGRTRINYSISQDAIREFQVNTSNYSAEFGRAAGGVVNSVTKSGTNDFHGTAFYYLRDNKFGARNAFSFQTISTPGGNQVVGLKPKDQRHQFGGSIGGPIVKDKLFFFFSYDQQIRDFPSVAAPSSLTFFNPITVVNLPFSDANTAVRTCINPVGGALSSGETLGCRGVTQTQFNSGLAFLQSLTGEVARKGDQTLFLPKIDWVINDKHTFSVVYNRLRWDSPAGVQTQAVVNRGIASFGDDLVSIDTLNARLNSSLSPSILNEFRFQYSRDLEQQLGQPAAPGEPTTANGFSPSVAIGGGGITFGKPNFLDRTAYPDEKRWQFANTTTITKGKHSIKFGGDFNRVSDLLDNLFQNAGAYSYNNLVDFISDQANPTTGGCFVGTTTTRTKCYTSFGQGFGPTAFEFSTKDYNFFYQHDIRVDQRLTLNFGLRYEFQQLPEPQIPNPLEARTSQFPSDKDNFGPRIGFALDVLGDGTTSVRSGYGIYYGRIINSTISNAITNTGVAAGQRQVSLTPSQTGSPLYPNVLTTPPTAAGSAGDIIVFAKDFEAPMIHQMDVVFERLIARNTTFSVSGLLSIGRSLPTFVDTNLNPASTTQRTYTFSGGPFNGQTITVPIYTGSRPNTNFGRITEIRNTIDTEYFGLVFQLNRRLTKGIQLQTSYTLSSSEDNGQASQTFSSPNVPLDPFNLSLEQGKSYLHVPHRFVASMVYAPETLFGLGKDSGVGKAILGGFTISPIVTIQNGRTYSAGTSGNATGGTSQGILGAGGAGRLPNLAPNTFRLPYAFNVDLRVSRRFRFTETMNFEVLAEGFNIFNRQNITNVGTRAYIVSGTTLTYDPLFGVPSEAGNSIFRERQVQFAARFNF